MKKLISFKELYLVFAIFFLSLQSWSQFTGFIEWQESYGGSFDERPYDVIATRDSGYAIVGLTHSNDVFVHSHKGNGGSPSADNDVYVIRINDIGDTLWTRTYGGTQNEIGYRIRQTCDGGFIVAGFSNSDDGQVQSGNNGDDFWVFKIDADGNMEWERAMGGLLIEWAYDVVQTRDGGYAVTGFARSGADGGYVHGIKSIGTSDYWVVKLNNAGDTVWTKTYGSSGADEARALLETNDGNLIIAGVTGTQDGDVDTTFGFLDIWLLEIDGNNGNIVQSKVIGGYRGEDVEEIIKTSDENYLLVGHTNTSDSGDISDSIYGFSDVWVVKLDENLNIIWDQTLGGDQTDYGYSVVESCDGYLVAARTESPTASGEKTENNPPSNFASYWLVELDKNTGAFVWDKTIGAASAGSQSDWLTAMDISANGYNYIMVGHSKSDSSSLGDKTVPTIDAISPGGFAYLDPWVVVMRDTTVATSCGISSKLQVTAQFESQYYCIYDSVSFMDQSFGDYIDRYVWNFGDGNGDSSSMSISPYHVYTDTGTYITSLIVSNYCISDTFLDTIVIKASPYVIDLNQMLTNTTTGINDTIICENENIILSIPWGDSLKYMWSDGSNASNLTITQPGKYHVAISDSQNNCQYSDTITILPCSGLFIPNAFSPSKGTQNNTFNVLLQGATEYELTINNRYGEKLFQSKSSLSWDGTYRGKPVEDNVYVYTFTALTATGENIFKTGTFTLIR